MNKIVGGFLALAVLYMLVVAALLYLLLGVGGLILWAIALVWGIYAA